MIQGHLCRALQKKDALNMSSLPPSGPPSTGEQDKRSISAHPRPKPPPIVTKRSVSTEPKPAQQIQQKALPEPPKSRPPPRPQQIATKSEGDVSEQKKIKESRSSSPALERKKSIKSSSPSASRKSKAGLISLKSPTSGSRYQSLKCGISTHSAHKINR